MVGSRPPTTVVVFGGSSPVPGDPEYENAVQCGRGLAELGIAVATGGYGGTMEAVSRGAANAGGHVIGVTAPSIFSTRSAANEYVIEEDPAPTLARRVARLIEISDAAIALPGSIGTLTELVVAWNTSFVSRFSDTHEVLPLVTVGPVWAELVDHLAETLETDRSLVDCVSDVDAALVALRHRLGL